MPHILSAEWSYLLTSILFHASRLLLFTTIMAEPFRPYTSTVNGSAIPAPKINPGIYGRSTPVAPLSPGDIQARIKPPAIIQPAVAPIGDYERIKAKIDQGVKMQTQGEDLVADGLKEMVATKAYLKKYNSIAAFAEHEYGQTRDWVYGQIRNRLPQETTDKAGSGERHTVTNKALTQDNDSEPEKTHIKTLDEVRADNAQVDKESSKPPMDDSGCVIPQCLLANDLRDRIKEVTEAAYWASKLKCLFEKLQTDNDPLFARAKDTGSVQTFMTGAARMHHALADCSPDIVCPECGGIKKTCHYCCATGWISQSRWHQDWEKSGDRLKQAEVHRRATTKAKYD